MRRRLELYIGDRLADVGSEKLILFNYTAEEVSNPAIVKNAYSQQLTLEGTDRNNVIFQSYFRADAAPGQFNPSKRVPFSIFADGGRLVESGYVKLDNVVTTKGRVQYKVTLYGALGGFLYALHYSDDGTKSLADLRYISGNDELSLDFVINRDTIKQAWAELLRGRFDHAKWNLINFAPCYNGVPENFDAKRAMVLAEENGLKTEVKETRHDPDHPDDPDYDYEVVVASSRRGLNGMELPEDMTEWQVKDMRSYHQRPVIKARSVLSAICNPVNNGGYTVNLDPAFFNEDNPYYTKTWMTLKRLTTMKLPVVTGKISGTNLTTTQSQITIDFQDVPMASSSEINIDPIWPESMDIPVGAVPNGKTLYWYCRTSQDGMAKWVYRGLAVQAVAYDEDDNAIAGSRVLVFSPFASRLGSAYDFCQLCNYTPRYDTGEGEEMYKERISGNFVVEDDGVTAKAVWHEMYSPGHDYSLTIHNARGAVKLVVYIDRIMATSHNDGSPTSDADYTATWPKLQKVSDSFHYSDLEETVDVNDVNIRARSYEWQYVTDEAVRTGATITKQMLLSDTMSPAEFLLSYCKRFGLLMTVDDTTRTINILARETAYQSGAVDLSGRINRAKQFTITPVAYDSQRFEFSEEDAGSGYAKDYKARFGREYGIQLVNTGYEFNAETKKLFDGSKFKTAAEVKDRDLTYLTIVGPARPAVFLHTGLKYFLFSGNNRDTSEFVVPVIPSSSGILYYDTTYKTYDMQSRLQLCDDERKPVDGDGVLVFFQGEGVMPQNQTLSDDIPEMYLGNYDKPCWILDAKRFYTGEAALTALPLFGRHLYSDADRLQIARTMDFGIPMELDIPDVTIGPDSGVYAAFWRRYIQDRYGPATKVMKAYVCFNAMEVSAKTLRRFYWIDGVLWALNKISNYDLDGYGTYLCEFVQVQDMENYLYQLNFQ